jgi:hypothetical protein
MAGLESDPFDEELSILVVMMADDTLVMLLLKLRHRWGIQIF